MMADDVARGERKTLGAQSEPGFFPDPQVGSITLMLLRLGTRWFGVDVRAIEEVALKGTVTRVPMAPSHILGVTLLRGRLVTVVGLEQMTGGPGLLSCASTATLPRLVVVRDGEYEMAIVAEGIHGMTEYVSAAAIDPDRPAGGRPSSLSSRVVNDAEPPTPEFVREEFDWHGNRVSLLDAPLLVATAARLAGILSPSEEVDT